MLTPLKTVPLMFVMISSIYVLSATVRVIILLLTINIFVVVISL